MTSFALNERGMSPGGLNKRGMRRKVTSDAFELTSSRKKHYLHLRHSAGTSSYSDDVA